MKKPSAYREVKKALRDDEVVEAVVFGSFGWGDSPKNGEWESGYMENTIHVPFEKRGKILDWETAQTYMNYWSFLGGFGSPECYSVYIWTNQRVFFVVQYDGATSLCDVPRNPEQCLPEMFGG